MTGGERGKSYLAKAQINFASRLSHPALEALAPWEGFSDIYRQLLCRGGFAKHNTFMSKYQWGVAGNHEVEDMAQMVKTPPLFDEYWAGKDDPVERVTKKWMRVHANFEWYEMYERNSNDDLQRFFDRYCKGILNGWEHDTPPLRLSLHGCGFIPNIVERPETKFPLRRQRLETYYLDAATKTLLAGPPDTVSSVCHEAHGLKAPTSDFVLRFDQYTEIAGYAKLLEGVNFPCPAPESEVPHAEASKLFGPQGFLRASSTVSRDQSRSSLDGQEVFYRHDHEKIVPGTIVPLDMTLWPMAIVFAAGEGIMLRVGGHFLSAPSVEVMRPQEAEDENVGQHYIHTGGERDSVLILPVIAGNRA
ncbi:hypothetical protein BJX62DRAFT_245138 [Aspergillus germanicus]